MQHAKWEAQVRCTVSEQFKSVNFATVKMRHELQCNTTTRHFMKLEHAYIIFVSPFTIKASKYALTDDLKDV